MTWQIVRNIYPVQIIRSPSGPRGQAAGQDVGWLVKGSLGAGEVLNLPPVPHAATFAAIYAHSDSGFSGPQTLTVEQVRAGSVIATATLPVGAAATDWQTTISAMVFAVADVPRLILPNPQDSQCTDLSVSLGSTP